MMKEMLGICAVGMAIGSCSPKKSTQPTVESASNRSELTMLVGTYTTGESKGIYTFRFDEESGVTTPLSEAVVENPSYLTLSLDGRFVYAVTETDEQSAVTAFAFDKETGVLQQLNSQPTDGKGPCYISTNGELVVTANYKGGCLSVLTLADDGKLLPSPTVFQFKGSGMDKDRQNQPHAHCAVFTPDGKYLLVTDLGTDKIHKFIVQPKSEKETAHLTMDTLDAFSVTPGAGPRHLTFSSNGRYAYLINELSGMVNAFEYSDGMLKEIQTIASDTVGARGSADIHISPDGKFLYASNRLQADGLAVFRINENDGTLTKAGYQLTGIHPRNFNITPNGKYLLVACRDSNVIQVYLRDIETGLLTDTKLDIQVDKPVCIKFVE